MLGVEPAALLSEELKLFHPAPLSLHLWAALVGELAQSRSIPSDCVWGPALSETINRCLTQHLEELNAPVGTLAEAVGDLHLDSSPDESDVAPGSIPGETLVTGACDWKCVCYGIGNFATCVIARNQLTFLLLFLEKCQVHLDSSLWPIPWSCTRCAHRHLG